MAKQLYVYGCSGTNNDDLDYLKGWKMADAIVAGHGLDHVSQEFVNACNSAGVTPIYNGGNEESSTCGGPNEACYANLAQMGYQSAGGESTAADEMMAAQQAITYYCLDGQYTDDDHDSFANHGFQVVKGGKGVIFYCESYNFNGSASIANTSTLPAMVSAAIAGCVEVGIMIGAWMPDDPSFYAETALSFIDKGYKFSGFHLWGGADYTFETNIGKMQSCIESLQDSFPPDTRTLKQRLAGATPSTPVTPPPPPPVEQWYSILNG
jgi:hypothetical protein